MQPLIAQVPTGKSRAIPSLHGGLQLSKITKKNKWDVENLFLLHPHISGIFKEMYIYTDWFNFRKNSQFDARYLLSILLMCASLRFLFMGELKKSICNEPPPHIKRIENKYLVWNWHYFGNLINPCKCTYPKKIPEMCGWRWPIFPTSQVRRYVIFLCNFT